MMELLFATLMLLEIWDKLVQKLQMSCEVKFAKSKKMGAGNGFSGIRDTRESGTFLRRVAPGQWKLVQSGIKI